MKTLLLILLLSQTALAAKGFQFSDADRSFLSQLALSHMKEPKDSRGNQYLANEAIAKLGQRFFFDKRFSPNNSVACATCHVPHKYFTDGLPQAKGISQTRMNSPSVLLSKWSPWQFWNGRKDSLWSQALGPLESPQEHGFSRYAVAKLIANHYYQEYVVLFKSEKDLLGMKTIKTGLKKHDAQTNAKVNAIFTNVGKSIMAYEHRLQLKPSKFDRFVKAIGEKKAKKARQLFSKKEVAGLKLFVGKGNCISCHNGPLLTNFEFHNVGVPEFDKTKVDMGRSQGVLSLKDDEFTCLSKHSAAKPTDCKEMRFLKTSGPELVGAFKTPSLRNVAQTAPYMHSGQLATLEDVVEHYNKPKPPFYDRKQHPSRPHFDILPLGLTDDEKMQLVAFLKTLTSPMPKNDPWWEPIESSQKL